MELEHLSDRELLIKIATETKHIKENTTDHEERIRGLETKSNWLIGGISVIGALFGIHLGIGK